MVQAKPRSHLLANSYNNRVDERDKGGCWRLSHSRVVPGDLRLNLPGHFLLLRFRSLDGFLLTDLSNLPVHGVSALGALQQRILPEQDHYYACLYEVILLMPLVYCLTSTLSFLSVVTLHPCSVSPPISLWPAIYTRCSGSSPSSISSWHSWHTTTTTIGSTRRLSIWKCAKGQRK